MGSDVDTCLGVPVSNLTSLVCAYVHTTLFGTVLRCITSGKGNSLPFKNQTKKQELNGEGPRANCPTETLVLVEKRFPFGVNGIGVMNTPFGAVVKRFLSGSKQSETGRTYLNLYNRKFGFATVWTRSAAHAH